MYRKRFCAVLLALIMALSMYTAPAVAAPKAKVAAQRGLDQAEVKRAQQRLIDLGFLAGKADGAYGKGTKSAVKAFQTYANGQGHSLSEDGTLGPQTLTLLFDEAVAERRYAIRNGDQGELVIKLQKRLIKLGYLASAPDGGFGADVQRALTAFQQMLVDSGVEGVQASGIADTLTRAYLYERDLSAFDIRTPMFFDDRAPLSLEDCYLYAESYVLINATSGEVLRAKNERQKMDPASTTKLMTLLLGLTRSKLKGTITVPEAAAKVPGDSSRVPVTPGEQMSYMDLLYGMMIRSGNDAANAVAVLTSGSIDQFVGAMNQKAGALGMTDTHFVNAHGYYDSEHYTTAMDMATLMKAVLEDEKARTVIETKRYTMAATAKRKALALENTYELLNAQSQNYSPYARGGKTGFTSKAGQCFVGEAEQDGVSLIVVVLNSGYQKENKWMDAKRLLAYGFAKQAA